MRFCTDGRAIVCVMQLRTYAGAFLHAGLGASPCDADAHPLPSLPPFAGVTVTAAAG